MAEIPREKIAETTTKTEELILSEKDQSMVYNDGDNEEEIEYITGDDGNQYPVPTKEQWGTLREVADSVPKSAFLVIMIEFCERFTYYGLSGPFQNYIQQPPPPEGCKLIVIDIKKKTIPTYTINNFNFLRKL